MVQSSVNAVSSCLVRVSICLEKMPAMNSGKPQAAAEDGSVCTSVNHSYTPVAAGTHAM